MTSEIGQAIVDGYRRTPPVTRDAWGDLAQEADVEGHEMAISLDAEEAAAGMEPW